VDLIIRKADIKDYDKINELYWQSDNFIIMETYINERFTDKDCLPG